MKHYNEVTAVFGVIGGFLASMLGGWDVLLKVFLCTVVADYITGVIVAFMDHNLSSEIGFRGLIKKVLMIVAVGFACNLQTILTLPLREIILTFFIANEGISLTENLAKAGVPLPQQLKDTLVQLKKTSNSGDTQPVELVYPKDKEGKTNDNNI